MAEVKKWRLRSQEFLILGVRETAPQWREAKKWRLRIQETLVLGVRETAPNAEKQKSDA